MVDLQSQYKLYSFGYVSPTPRQGVPTARQLKHQANRQLAVSVGDRPVHDCRLESMKEFTCPKDWETQLLFYGLKQTFEDVESLHSKPTVQPPCPKREPDKLLFQVGIEGARDGDFRYPRDVITTQDGDIIVADTNNHRIIILSQFGVYKSKFGKKGNGNGKFLEPTGVSQLPNQDIVVADCKNKRIQIFTSDGVFKSKFSTKYEPYSVGTDGFKNIIVSTLNNKIEVYNREFILAKEFNLSGPKRKLSFVKICPYGDEQVFVVDSVHGLIQCYSYDGKLLQQFQPRAPDDGLFVVPGDVCFDHVGQLVVSDSLNHTVNIYTVDGDLIRQVLRPPDDVGAVFAFCIGPEGHLVATEFSLKGRHCVKIFRYNACECHADRPLSGKK